MRDVATGKLQVFRPGNDCECFDPGKTPKYYTVTFKDIVECIWEGGPWPSNANRAEVLQQSDVLPCVWQKVIDGWTIYLRLKGGGCWWLDIGWEDDDYSPSHHSAYYRTNSDCVKTGIFANALTSCGANIADCGGGHLRAMGINGTAKIEPGSLKVVEAWSTQRLPTSDISVQWDRSAGNDNFALVDDPVGSHDVDTTYTQTATGGNKDLFGFTSFGVPAGGTVVNVKVIGYFKRIDAGGAEIIRTLVKVNDVVYNGTPWQLVTGAYFEVSHTWSVNPATSLAWTVADANGVGVSPLQAFGYEALGFQKTIRCTQIYVEVNYNY